MATLKDMLAVFQAGRMVANPTAWKRGQVHANQIASILAALLVLARFLGWDVHMDDTTMAVVAAGVFALVNWVFTVVSTDKVGGLGGTVPADAAPADAAAGPMHDGP
jgi:hypothetical protein